MGRKGNRKPGSFAHDYDNLVVWNTHIDITEEQLDAICDAGDIQMDESLRKQLKAEIESFASLAEAEKEAPPVGGSGRSNDFFNQHIQRIAKIYEKAGGEVSLKRKNPSKDYPRGSVNGQFFEYCRSINLLLPRELARPFNGGASDGLAMAVRRALKTQHAKSISIDH